MQQPPAEMPKPATAPIIPPLAVPVTPSWKQEPPKSGESSAAGTPAVPPVSEEQKESNE
jgi:hypothetical protein